MSDRDRLRKHLEAGRDVRTHEWVANAPDGAKPILRVGARIKELRDEGMRILTVEDRPSALYRLVEAATAGAGAPTPTKEGASDRSDARPAPAVAPHMGIHTEHLPVSNLSEWVEDDGDDSWLGEAA